MDDSSWGCAKPATYSCNVLDAFANALALLFINDIDERVFDIMKLFGWVADLRNEDTVVEEEGATPKRCCNETAEQVCGESTYVFFTQFAPIGWIIGGFTALLHR